MAVAAAIKMDRSENTSSSLAILIAAAAAITSSSCARGSTDNGLEDTAAKASTATQFDYRYSEYDEDGLSVKAADGDARRYEVRTQQFHLVTGVDRGELTVNGTHEVMSGSSPWFVLPDGDHRPVQVMSGATIRESRQELAVTWTADPDPVSKTAWTVSYSSENDYRAAALGFDRSQSISPSTTLGYGASFSHDLIDPFDAASFARIDHAEKNTASAFASLAWVLNRSAVLQSGIEIADQHGFLSDPYKLVYVGNSIIHDDRPDRRMQYAWLMRYRQALAEQDAALHLDYRFSWDTWGIRSHTLEVSWYQHIGSGWQLVPGLRYYSQQQARFYAPFFTSSAGRHDFSSDYRLGTFGAVSAQLNLRKSVGPWQFSVGAERYHSATEYAFGGQDAAVPALVSFTRLFIGFDRKFD